MAVFSKLVAAAPPVVVPETADSSALLVADHLGDVLAPLLLFGQMHHHRHPGGTGPDDTDTADHLGGSREQLPSTTAGDTLYQAQLKQPAQAFSLLESRISINYSHMQFVGIVEKARWLLKVQIWITKSF